MEKCFTDLVTTKRMVDLDDTCPLNSKYIPSNTF
jgi:hypothetical protein